MTENNPALQEARRYLEHSRQQAWEMAALGDLALGLMILQGYTAQIDGMETGGGRIGARECGNLPPELEAEWEAAIQEYCAEFGVPL